MREGLSKKPTYHISLWLNSPARIVEFLFKDQKIKHFFEKYFRGNNFSQLDSNAFWLTRSYFRTENWFIFSMPKDWLKPNIVYSIYIAWKWESWNEVFWEFRIHPEYEDNAQIDPKKVDFELRIFRRKNLIDPKSINIEVAKNQNFTAQEKVTWVIDTYARKVAKRLSNAGKKLWKSLKWKK